MKMLLMPLALLAVCSFPADAKATQAPLAAADTQATALVRYSARDFFDTTSYGMSAPSGFAFSPDGKTLLISNDASGVFNAYLLPVAGGDPTPLTTSNDNATFATSFFPSDGRVLFSADSGGNELNHVYVRELDGTVRDLTPGDTAKAGFLGWKRDGSEFFVTSNERNPQMFDIYAYDSTSYERRRVFENEGYVVGAISPDGRHVALVKAHSSANSDVFLADLDSGKPPQLITPHEGNVAYGVHGFTPGSEALVFSTNEKGEFEQAWQHDLASGEQRPLIESDWDVMFVSFSPTGRYRVHAINEDASTRLTIADAAGKRVALHGVPEGDIGQVRFNHDESMIAFTVASDTSPSDIFVADLESGKARRLTTALNPAIDESQLVNAEIVRFASFDGLQIPGVLYRPREASASNPVPVIVMIHGGPGGQSRRGYSPMFQHLVNNGYAVYAINNRGSSGYGKTFFHLDDRRHGDVDLKDVVASKDYLQGLDWIAADRIAVGGGSYGGYLTAAALAFHPEVFDAGINIFGVTNWVRTLESIPAWWGAQRVALYDEMGDPAVDGERHRAMSPLFHADRIVRPMLVVQGANDPRVLQVESDELVAAIRARDVPVEYLLFPDEGHGFLRKENRIAASEAYLSFLDRYIGRAAAPAHAAQ
jgi:dipeptidyl aminopeptidase/acylaminoacyl peptidase